MEHSRKLCVFALMPVFPQERMPCCIHCPHKSVITVK